MTARLNARIDAELSRKIALLQERTGATVTGVIKESIERYYAATITNVSAQEAVRKTGFVGCASGPADLARTYKARLRESLRHKHNR